MSDKYHHGNLKQELIEQGLKIINEEGEDKLSFRKVTSVCGVSHTAAYAHFSDKDDMVNAIKVMVAEQFASELISATENKDIKGAAEKIIAMGRRYVSFFLEKPDYYRFLFGNRIVKVHFDIEQDYEEDFPAFRLLKKLYIQMNTELGKSISKEGQEKELVRIWSTVHGLASIACMKDVFFEGDWEEIINECVN